MGEFAAIDFETTGYEDGLTNEPWQLGFALVRDGELVETREWFFRAPGAPEGHPEEITFESLLASFEVWSPQLIGRRLVAHNLACEKTILTRTAPLTKWGPWTDTLKIVRARYPRLKSYQLGDVCELLDCVPRIEGRTWHDGLFDAVACANLAVKLASFI